MARSTSSLAPDLDDSAGFLPAEIITRTFTRRWTVSPTRSSPTLAEAPNQPYEEPSRTIVQSRRGSGPFKCGVLIRETAWLRLR